MKNHAYVYKYDELDRCILKKLPGRDAITMKYDKADRLIFSQDGNQKDNTWTFFFYDMFGRLTVTGIWKSSVLPPLDNLVVKTDYTGTGTLAGYTVNLALPAVDIMTVNYHDNYTFINNLTAHEKAKMAVITLPGYDNAFPSNAAPAAKGLLTGTRVYQLNSSATVTLAEYTHDEVGRVKTKKRGPEISGYSYNTRDWLVGIAGTRFSQTLAYNSAVNGISPAIPRYNGNIGAMKWKAGDESTERGYQFTHDGLDRLVNANYGEGSAITANANRFNEKLSYDKMGNILTLQRRGKVIGSTYNLIDDLTYTYNGNQLTKVSDAVTTPITNEATLHFVDGANTSNEYTYDANGNLTRDLNKNITSITYNSLNLPSVITFGDGKTITYGYDASGSKSSVTYDMGNGVTSKMEYAGNKVYKNDTLATILIEEGYITMDGTVPKYHYYLKDHQGNNRVVIDQAGTEPLLPFRRVVRRRGASIQPALQVQRQGI